MLEKTIPQPLAEPRKQTKESAVVMPRRIIMERKLVRELDEREYAAWRKENFVGTDVPAQTPP